jgi:hypothetical protein
VRGLQIDVRLDEVVLRALEKEPELRYQQASGLKSEVETIATSTTRSPSGSAESHPHSSESFKTRWLVLVVTWVLAGTVLWLQARLVNQYLNTAGQLGLRGASAASTPLQQIYPGFAADAQMWVQHALALTEDDKLQLRHTNIDNAPKGREVHWNSAWAWCIAGAGKLHQLFTGLPLPRAVERATLWLNPVVMFGLIVLLSSWAARRLGLIAGVVVVVAMTCHDRIYEGFFPSYVDHHGILAVAVLGLILGAVVMGGGWWRRNGGAFSVLPGSIGLVRRGALFSALSGACGMWVSAASTIPAIAIVGFSGLVAMVVQGRAAVRQGAVFDPGAWRLWGRLGGGTSFVFYLIEYFPGHVGFRLEANHPLHALAWLGAAEFIAQLGERWLAPRAQRWQHAGALLWPVLAIAVVATIAVGGHQVLSVMDPFLATLHRDYISEMLPLWKTLRNFDRWSLIKVILVGGLPLLAAIATLCYPRRDTVIVLWFVTFATAALTAMAWLQSRWLINASAASIVLILVLLAHWTAKFRPIVGWTLALAILGMLFAPGAVQRHTSSARDVANRRVSPSDAANALSRDIAAALRASQPQGEIVLLASPNASETIGYYGRLKTLGTLYWENIDGLRSAAKIFGADTEAEAASLIRAHGVTHIAIVSAENFIAQYYRLLNPAAADSQVQRCFGIQLMREKIRPSWLQPLTYEVPADLKSLNTTVQLFKVRFD